MKEPVARSDLRLAQPQFPRNLAKIILSHLLFVKIRLIETHAGHQRLKQRRRPQTTSIIYSCKCRGKEIFLDFRYFGSENAVSRIQFEGSSGKVLEKEKE